MSVSIAGKGSPIGYDRGIALLAKIKKLLGEEVVVTDQDYIDAFSNLISSDEYGLELAAKNKDPLKGGNGFNQYNFIKSKAVLATPKQVAYDVKDFYINSGFKSITFKNNSNATLEVEDFPESWDTRDSSGLPLDNFSYTLTV